MRTLMLLCMLLFQYDSKPATNQAGESVSTGQTPTYTADGRLMFPANYREWVYLTSGLDMSYSPNPGMTGHSMFDNVL